MDEIIEELQRFNFSKMEAKVYVTLVQNPDINGYQIAKILNIPRSTVYSCLDNLYEKGAVFLIAGEKNLYQANDPETFFENLKSSYTNSANSIKEELKKLTIKTENNQYFNIEGYDNLINKIKEMIKNSKNEIYLNLGMGIDDFREELNDACDRGVRVIVFTFGSIDFGDMKIELYRSKKLPELELSIKTIFLVSDMEKALIANGNESLNFSGTYSENSFFASGISSYIHLDIYMYKLEQEFGRDLITEKIRLQTMKEENFRSIMKK